MKEKVLILGASGMLGHTLFKYFSRQKDFVTAGTARSKSRLGAYYTNEELSRIYEGVDGDNIDSFVDVFGKFRPDIVINCIGIIKQLKEGKDPFVCLNINALLPHKLVRLASLARARMIQISTDCVFDGKKGGYTEDDPANAEDVYGKTKNLGELTDYPNAITIRTSIIGHELNKSLSLIDWFLGQEGSVNGYTKAIYTGFPTIEIAEIIRNHVIPHPELSGLYHVTSEPINKYELLRLVSEVYEKKIEIKPFDDFTLDRSMRSDRFRKATGYCPPAWKELVIKMCEEYKYNKKER